MRYCTKSITTHNGMCVTYCMRDDGHQGKCSTKTEAQLLKEAEVKLPCKIK